MQYKGNNAAYKTISPASTAGIYSDTARGRNPFSLPATGYYGMAAAASGGVFILVFSLLQDNGSEYAVFWACASAITGISIAILLREIVLRTARERLIAARQQLDSNIRRAMAANGTAPIQGRKLTLEQNAEMIRVIRKKSDAAKIFGGIAQGHREVFDLCENYLVAIRREMPKVGAGSPRIAAFRRGEKLVRGAHRFHLLRWAEIEARLLTRKAAEITRIGEKLAVSREALDVVGFALRHYPNEADLRDSEAVLHEHIESLTIADLLERAEKAALRGNAKRAEGFYKEAADLLSANGNVSPDRQEALRKITIEIEKLGGANNNI